MEPTALNEPPTNPTTLQPLPSIYNNDFINEALNFESIIDFQPSFETDTSSHTGNDPIGQVDQSAASSNTAAPITSKRLSNLERQHIIEILIANLTKTGKSAKGLISKTARDFNISRRTISTLWKTASEQICDQQLINLKTKYAGKVGRKRTELDLSKLVGIPLRRRTNIRSLSKALGIPKSTTHRLIQTGEIHSHTNAIKPHLTEENTQQRLEFVLLKLETVDQNENACFRDMTNAIHIDEKWFYMTRMSQRYYLAKKEVEPIRTCKSKRYVTKVMFLGIVTPPRYGEEGTVIFDGKIGIFPFIVIEPAKRNSKNRAAGDMECKPITSVTKQVIKKCLIEQVISAIKAKWPLDDSRPIFIQQDNARPHIRLNDPDFVKAATSDGFDIRLMFQPSNSSDLNVLDLGLFNAIQSLQHEFAPRNVVELVDAVVNSFNPLQPRTLSNVWLTLQYCMLEILKAKETNAYEIPHVNKTRMAREGILPTNVEDEATIVAQTLDHLEGTAEVTSIHS